ncbi:MAG: glycosyltransferase [Thermoguttaceae bacterium]
MPASISVIVPVYNGAALLDRAIRSVLLQTYSDWELIAVDDGSSDESHALLQAWADKDRRIRVIGLPENRGLSAARNAALRAVGGQMVTYLDHDDEFFPNYLELVMRHQDKGDALVFGYDIVYETARPVVSDLRAMNEQNVLAHRPERLDVAPTDSAAERVESWDPGRACGNFFVANPVVPLGVSHHRSLLEKVGGFNEMLWREEDWDFWKRLARAGAEFFFLPLKSGRYHVRPNSLIRAPHLTKRQRETLMENWRNGRPIFEDRSRKSGSPGRGPDLECGNSLPLSTAINDRLGQEPDAGVPLELATGKASPRQGQSGNEFPHSKGRTVAFVSPHCILDFTNGAATATLDGLAVLARSGFACQAFCSSHMDAWEEVRVEELLARRGVRYEVHNARIGPHRARMTFTTHEKIPVTLFNSASTRGGWINDEEIAAFLAGCEAFLTQNRPDVVWTYGGEPVSCAVQQLAKRLDIPILFALHNFAYRDASSFQMADYVIVPTEFCRQYYWDTIGLASLKLPLVVDPARVSVDGSAHHNPRAAGEGYVTLVNPEPRKGIHVFARIAEVLSRQRPDIPLLIVEGVEKARFLPHFGIDLSGVTNLRMIPNSPDARGFLAMTKILLMPSLMENAGLVAMEAMINGIPVLGSNRGGLPETIGDAGFLFNIPAKYTPETREVPTAEEVAPWVEAIIRLWDDSVEYERWSKAGRNRSQQWHPDHLVPLYREFFGQLTHQPGPPLVPRLPS